MVYRPNQAQEDANFESIEEKSFPSKTRFTSEKDASIATHIPKAEFVFMARNSEAIADFSIRHSDEAENMLMNAVKKALKTTARLSNRVGPNTPISETNFVQGTGIGNHYTGMSGWRLIGAVIHAYLHEAVDGVPFLSYFQTNYKVHEIDSLSSQASGTFVTREGGENNTDELVECLSRIANNKGLASYIPNLVQYEQLQKDIITLSQAGFFTGEGKIVTLFNLLLYFVKTIFTYVLSDDNKVIKISYDKIDLAEVLLKGDFKKLLETFMKKKVFISVAKLMSEISIKMAKGVDLTKTGAEMSEDFHRDLIKVLIEHISEEVNFTRELRLKGDAFFNHRETYARMVIAKHTALNQLPELSLKEFSPKLAIGYHEGNISLDPVVVESFNAMFTSEYQKLIDDFIDMVDEFYFTQKEIGRALLPLVSGHATEKNGRLEVYGMSYSNPYHATSARVEITSTGYQYLDTLEKKPNSASLRIVRTQRENESIKLFSSSKISANILNVMKNNLRTIVTNRKSQDSFEYNITHSTIASIIVPPTDAITDMKFSVFTDKDAIALGLHQDPTNYRVIPIDIMKLPFQFIPFVFPISVTKPLGVNADSAMASLFTNRVESLFQKDSIGPRNKLYTLGVSQWIYHTLSAVLAMSSAAAASDFRRIAYIDPNFKDKKVRDLLELQEYGTSVKIPSEFYIPFPFRIDQLDKDNAKIMEAAGKHHKDAVSAVAGKLTASSKILFDLQSETLYLPEVQYGFKKNEFCLGIGKVKINKNIFMENLIVTNDSGNHFTVRVTAGGRKAPEDLLNVYSTFGANELDFINPFVGVSSSHEAIIRTLIGITSELLGRTNFAATSNFNEFLYFAQAIIDIDEFIDRYVKTEGMISQCTPFQIGMRWSEFKEQIQSLVTVSNDIVNFKLNSSKSTTNKVSEDLASSFRTELLILIGKLDEVSRVFLSPTGYVTGPMHFGSTMSLLEDIHFHILRGHSLEIVASKPIYSTLPGFSNVAARIQSENIMLQNFNRAMSSIITRLANGGV